MYKVLNPLAIGLKATLTEVVEMVITYGFQGIDVQIELVSPLETAMGLKYCQQIIGAGDSICGSWILPTLWRDENEAVFQKELAELPELSRLAHDVGFSRVTTGVWPVSETRTAEENFEWCKNRLQQIADIVGKDGHRLGLEYLSTKKLREGKGNEFIHDLKGLKPLVDAIGRENVGYVLDSWHWHMAGETADDIRSLKPEQIVAVHVNDAPADIPNDEQVDNVRRLPGTTGVIDIETFMQTLSDIGYDGPVTAEPFPPGVRTLNKNRVVEYVSDSLDRVWFRKDELAAEAAAKAEREALAATPVVEEVIEASETADAEEEPALAETETGEE